MSDSPDWPNNITRDARCNDEAHYSDGLYAIEFTASDVDYNDNPNNEVTQKPDILLDNFLPYVKKVEITSGSSTIYSAEWIWNGGVAQLEFSSNTYTGIADGNGDVEISITASEPMNDVCIGITGASTITPTISGHNTENTIWVFSVNQSQIQAAYNGRYNLSIDGDDLAGNNLNGFSTTTSVSATSIPIHQSDGSWDPQANPQHDDIHEFEIDVLPALEAFFTISPIPPYDHVPITLNFDATNSIGQITHWSWDFGDDSPQGDGVEVSHTYASAGTYTIELTVFDGSYEKYYTETIVITENDNPQANFSYNRKEDAVIEFIDKSGGVIDTWNWNFGDGYTSAEKNPTHDFNYTGDYSVSLTVDNSSSTPSTMTKLITVVKTNENIDCYYTNTFDNNFTFTAEVGLDWWNPANEYLFLFIFTKVGETFSTEKEISRYSDICEIDYTFTLIGEYNYSVEIMDNTTGDHGIKDCGNFTVHSLGDIEVDVSISTSPSFPYENQLVVLTANTGEDTDYWYRWQITGPNDYEYIPNVKYKDNTLTTIFPYWGDYSIHVQVDNSTENGSGMYSLYVDKHYDDFSCLNVEIQKLNSDKFSEDNIIQKSSEIRVKGWSQVVSSDLCKMVYTSDKCKFTLEGTKSGKSGTLNMDGEGDDGLKYYNAYINAPDKINGKKVEDVFGRKGKDNLKNKGHYTLSFEAWNSDNGRGQNHSGTSILKFYVMDCYEKGVSILKQKQLWDKDFLNTTILVGGAGENILVNATYEKFYATEYILFKNGFQVKGNGRIHAKTFRCPSASKSANLNFMNSPSVFNLSDTSIYKDDRPKDISKGTANFNVWPNPFSDNINTTFSINEETNIGIMIYDMYGRKIKSLINEIASSGTHENSFNLSYLSPGVYKCTFYSKKLTKSIKIIKTH